MFASTLADQSAPLLLRVITICVVAVQLFCLRPDGLSPLAPSALEIPVAAARVLAAFWQRFI
jgi:hypothetical protein